MLYNSNIFFALDNFPCMHTEFCTPHDHGKIYDKAIYMLKEVELTMSISPLCCLILEHNRKAKRSLCFSNKDRQTLQYRPNVKKLLMLITLCLILFASDKK